jgi:hypothetical protein
MSNRSVLAPGPGSRRIGRRMLVSLLALLALHLVVGIPEASAGRRWCMTDPAILVGGRPAYIYVWSSLEAPQQVTGPTWVRVTVPPGVAAEYRWADNGFGRGYQVEFAEDPVLTSSGYGIQTRVEVYVPAHGLLPVRLQIRDGSGIIEDVYGYSNGVVTATGQVGQEEQRWIA